MLSSCRLCVALPADAAEADVRGRGIDRLCMTRRRPIAAAIIRRTQMRAALDHLAGNLDVRKAGVVAVLLSPAARVFWNTAGLRRVGLVLCRPPVRGPFPYI